MKLRDFIRAAADWMFAALAVTLPVGASNGLRVR
jgi:hypothetical protein